MVFLPPNHSGLGGIRGLMLPTYARLTARRTYSLRMAQFWDAYLLAKNCKLGNLSKFCLTMADLTLPARGIVPNGDLYHLPAEASLLPAKRAGLSALSTEICPATTHAARTFFGPPKNQNQTEKVLTRGGVAPPD